MSTDTTEWEYIVVTRKEFPHLAEKCKTKPKTDHIYKDDVPCTALNTLGADGWELVAVSGDEFYFKRPVKYYENF